jgi:hypothetical protein
MMSGAEGSESFADISPGWCMGLEADFRLQGLLYPVWDFPLLEFGSAPLTALAWGGLLLSVRTRHPWLGRILARSAATVLIVRHLPSPPRSATRPRRGS